MHLTRRRALWTAGITGCCAAAGLAAAPPPARAAIAAEVPFTCASAVGVHRVTARVSARTPARAAAGKTVRPGAVSLDLAVPDALREEMLRGGAPAPAAPAPAASGVADGPARVSGVASLSVIVSAAGQAAETNWPVIDVRGDDPGSGPLRLHGEGTAPGVVAPAQGTVTWTASRLAFALTVDADGATASSPAMVCAPERRTVLGAVPVTAAPGSSPGAPPPARQAAKAPECIRVPDYKTDPAWDFNEDPRLWNVFEKPSLPDPQDPTKWVENPADPSKRRGVPYCIRAAGFANVKKVGAATPVAALTLLRRAVYGIGADRAGGNTANYFQQRGYFNTEAMPSNASVLSFGFMPTTATALVQQVAPPGANPTGLTTGNIRSDIALNAGLPGATRNGKELGDETWARSFVQMSVGKASVNGLAIDLGRECGTAPTLLDLNTFTGDYRTGRLSITEGSALTGHLEIPKFTHCGVTEDLSPLLTASISGPGNYVQIESGPWCNTNVSTEKCDETTEPRTWTVTPGGALTMTQSPLVLSGDGTGAEIRCDSLVLKANLREGHWNSRFVIGKVDDVRFKGCVRRSADGQESPAKLAPVGTPWAFNLLTTNTDGTVVAQISRIFFNANVAAGCAVRFGASDANLPVAKAGKLLGNYDNASHSYTVTGDGQFKVNGAECPNPPAGFEIGARYSVQGGPFVFDPAQKITQP